MTSKKDPVNIHYHHEQVASCNEVPHWRMYKEQLDLHPCNGADGREYWYVSEGHVDDTM